MTTGMSLLAQGPGMSAANADELAGIVQASAVDRLAEHAYRLRKIKLTPSVESWCDARKIDHAWLPERRRFADLKLLAMDMDSTLITIECIDELGDLAGKKDEVAAITAQAMRGEIEYPESLRRRVGLLAGLKESELQRVYQQRLKLTPGADVLLAACKKHGVKLLLVSGGFAFFTERLKERLGFEYTVSNVLEIVHGRLTGKLVGEIVDADAKAAKFLSVLKEIHAAKEQSVAIGDGANDLKMMAEAGTSIAFHAKPVVRAQATFALNHSGLDGVVNLFEH
jgi:phosphoserine phosphatase